jgi:hypothetical protein
MAAGLGFKDFATGEVLTAADVDGYLMQGIWVFASNAARDAAVTAPAEGNFAFTKDTNSLWYYDGAAWVASGATGDIEGVTAGVGISGGGTSGTVTVTNSMATEIDAKGDLIAGTGADTFARLAVGTNGHTLVADSAETTGLKWAAPSSGALTLIYSMPFTSSSAHNVNDVFSSTYDNYLVAISVDNGAADFCNLRFRVSGSDNTSSNYYWSDIFNQSSTQAPAGNYSNGLTTSWRLGFFEANSYGYSLVNIFNPNRTANTSANWEHNRFASNSTNQRGSGTLSVTTAYTGFTIFPPTGNMTGKVRVYGYQNS